MIQKIMGRSRRALPHFWSGLRDLNPRSLGPKPSAIPNFAKPGNIRLFCGVFFRCGQTCGRGHMFERFYEGGRGENLRFYKGLRAFGIFPNLGGVTWSQTKRDTKLRQTRRYSVVLRGAGEMLLRNCSRVIIQDGSEKSNGFFCHMSGLSAMCAGFSVGVGFSAVRAGFLPWVWGFLPCARGFPWEWDFLPCERASCRGQSNRCALFCYPGKSVALTILGRLRRGCSNQAALWS